MTRDDIIRMAREAGIEHHENVDEMRSPFCDGVWIEDLEHFVALVAAAEREKLAQWMMQRGYATGHGDTLEDLLQELDWQIAENWTRAMVKGVETERERCDQFLEHIRGWAEAYPIAIFPEPDFGKAHKVLTENSMTLDAISASIMRHVITQVKEMIDAAIRARSQ